MGTLTLTELKGEIQAALGNRTTQSSVTARLTRVLNMSQTRLARAYTWRELNTVLSLTTSFSGDLSADKFITVSENVRDYLSLVLVDGTSSVKLKYKPYRAIDREVPYPEQYTRRRPRIYTRFQGKLEIIPIPDAAYPINARVILWPTAFVDSSDVPSDLDNKDDLLIALAVSWFHMTFNDIDSANKWWRVYMNGLALAVAEDQDNPDYDAQPSSSLDTNYVESQEPWADPFVRGVE